MTIAFTRQQWDRIKDVSNKWWSGELERPLIHLVMKRAADRPASPLPAEHYLTNYPDDVSAETIVDRWDYELSCERYLGDAFPARWVNFGAGILAAMLGCRVQLDPHTVWFYSPGEGRGDWSLQDVKFKPDPANKWLQRISSIMQAANERFAGNVQIGMTDLGGTMDVLSSFRPGEQLLMDVIDDPNTVEKLVWQVHEHWWNAFHHFDAILRRRNPGWTCWTPIFSTKPYYMLQCDFCYMIGPEAFDRLVLSELAASCKRIPHPFYHLDGIGELPHLDSILSIKELKGVQWVPGDGKPHPGHWPDVLKRIRDAGKLVQINGNMEALEMAADKLGSVKGFCLCCGERFSQEREDEVYRFMERFKVPIS